MRDKIIQSTRRKARKKIDEILQEGKTAQAQKTDIPKVQERIARLLQEEPSLTTAVIEALGAIASSDSAPLLLDMLPKATKKDVVKAIKRSLYRLKQRGVQWNDTGSEGGSVLRPSTPGEPEGYLGPPDAAGSRFVVLVRSRPQRSARLFFSIVNDREGIQRFESNDRRAKTIKEFLGTLSSEDFPIVEAPAGYCVHILHEAAEATMRFGNAVPISYQHAKREWDDIFWDGAVPLVYQYINEDALKDQERRLRESADLHRVPPFSLWFLNPDSLTKHVQAVKEAEESRLALTPQQKDARLHDTYVAALQELFPDDTRLLWKRRLEEAAYILWKKGREKDAQTALIAAVDLKNSLNRLNPNPFVWALLLKSIFALIEPQRQQKEQKAQDSLIITP